MSPRPITDNTLFYGDDRPILREHVPDERVDLIYLDPPFNSNRSYNVLFREEGGQESQAQITAFEDTWHWNLTTEQTFQDLVTQSPEQVSRMIASLRDFVGKNQMNRDRCLHLVIPNVPDNGQLVRAREARKS